MDAKADNKDTLIDAFAAYRSYQGIAIVNIGKEEFKNQSSEGKKTKKNISGDNLEITKYNNDPETPFDLDDVDTCMLLLAEDSTLTSYYKAVLVKCLQEIAPAACELLSSNPES